MSEEKNTSPLLEGFAVGKPLSNHDGICCCPALKKDSEEKYIVKIISVPSSQVQIDALILTGACKTQEDALNYFREAAEGIVKEAELLNTTAKLEGFLPFDGWQIEPMDDGRLGYQVSLLSTYRRSLERYIHRRPITHLEAVNLGLDLCTALAICRRSGYLFVNLKPSNIFLTKTKEFRISDLGFVSLDSLAYTSLPGKYRSAYSAPETRDDMNTLNTTVDTYAAGMILYQIYNDGNLPEEPRNPKDPFPCPANADYEISSIIMKAVDPDPQKRWQSPMEMGQALVGYLQRNTVNNTPIMPPSGIFASNAAPRAQEAAAAPVQEEAPAAPVQETQQNAEPAPETEEIPTVQTDDGQTEPEVPAASEPEPEVSQEPVQSETEAEDEDDLDFSIAFQDYQQPENEEEKKPEPRKISELPQQRSLEKQERARKAKKLLSTIITILVLCAIAFGGFWFYQTQYLQTIDDLTISGTQDTLTVTVKTQMDESKLQVSCTDTYGNTNVQTLQDGKATFTGLLPDSLYRIELTTESFHQLQGKTAEIFTTDALTTVAAISAITGPEDGSVMVNFTVDGKDPDEWVITCTADGQETITQPFTGHSVTVKGLTPGAVYTLTLSASDGAPILGENSMEFQATNLVLAENLTIEACQDGILSVSWNAPADIPVERWTVRCYNDAGHEEVLEITGTEISFTGIDSAKAYTVEVTAAGMTNPTRVSVTANPITITDLTIDTSDPDKLTVDWTFDGEAPEGGWLLMYSFAGHTDKQNVVKCDTNQAVITNRIPGATYQFTVQAKDSTSIFNNVHHFSCPNAEIFNFEGMDAEKLNAYLVRTPEEEGWTADDMGEEDFMDTFQSGDSISLVLKSASNFFLPKAEISVLYVIRDGSGYVLSDYISRDTVDWKTLWYDEDYHIGELNLPTVPTESGDYNLSVYFNNKAITSIGFSIT